MNCSNQNPSSQNRKPYLTEKSILLIITAVIVIIALVTMTICINNLRRSIRSTENAVIITEDYTSTEPARQPEYAREEEKLINCDSDSKAELYVSPLTFDSSESDRKPLTLYGAFASSELIADGEHFKAENAVDGDENSCWQGTAAGNREDEYILVNLGSCQDVRIIGIHPGFTPQFEENSRPEKIQIDMEGESFSYTLKNENSFQYIELSRPVNTDYVKITISSSYSGMYFDDTCISEIELYS